MKSLVLLLKGMVGKWLQLHLMLRILIGVVIGATLALVIPGQSVISVLGHLFVDSLKAMAPLLVAVLVISSVSTAGGGLGSRFRSIILLYMFTTLIAAITAVTVARLFPVDIVLSATSDMGNVAPGALRDVFSNIVSGVMSNPVVAMMNANYLSILFWSVVLGIALKHVASPDTHKVVRQFADAVSMVIHWIIQCAPFGIMGLVYQTVSESGLDIFTNYGQLLALLVGCMLLVALVINPIVVGVLLRRNPYSLVWKCLKGSAVSAFFTRSSAANIPVNMSLCKRLGLDENFYSVSIPLGSIINMNGAAITITMMTLAACHTLGVELSFGSAILLCVVAALGACGTSGVAGGSLLLIPMACSLFGITNDISMQVVAVGFIIGVVQDSMETALNSSSDVLFTATAEFRERMRRGENIHF